MSVPSELIINNWMYFVMSRLNDLVKIDEYCDYTICSVTNESFKVHKVVLNACSDYFLSHPSTDKTITMPAHLNFNAVKSAIMFMYTGILHFTEEDRTSLTEVADMLQFTVLLKLLESQTEENKVTPDYNFPQASTSRTPSPISLNQYRPAKKPTTQTNMTVREPPKYTKASTLINKMKMKDILSENKPMQFECDTDDVPELIEQTFELPKYDSAPLTKPENCDGVKTMLKRAPNGELINKIMDKGLKTHITKCEAQTISSPAGKKLKIDRDTAPKNTNTKVVQEILKKYPHLLQCKGNIELKVKLRTNQSQFKSMIINTSDLVEKTISQPLVDVKFPQCDDCGFVATAEIHLEQHKSLKMCWIQPKTYTEYLHYTCIECGRIFSSNVMLNKHLINSHKVDDIILSTNEELFISIIDYIPPGVKVLAENNIRNETDDLGIGKDGIYNEKTIEEIIVTLEDAKQALEQNDDDCKPTVLIDLTEEWDDFDDVNTNKNKESNKKNNRDAKSYRI